MHESHFFSWSSPPPQWVGCKRASGRMVRSSWLGLNHDSTGPQWGRVHISAVTLAMLWGVVYNSVQRCRRLQTESRYLDLSHGPVTFSVCSLPEADSLEKLEIKIIQPFLETWLRKTRNLFLPAPPASWWTQLYNGNFHFFKKIRKPLTVIYLLAVSPLFGKMRWP